MGGHSRRRLGNLASKDLCVLPRCVWLGLCAVLHLACIRCNDPYDLAQPAVQRTASISKFVEHSAARNFATVVVPNEDCRPLRSSVLPVFRCSNTHNERVPNSGSTALHSVIPK